MGGSAKDIATAVFAPAVSVTKGVIKGGKEGLEEVTGAQDAKDRAKEAAKQAEADRAATDVALSEEEKKNRLAAARAASRQQSRVMDRSAGLGARSTILTSPLGIVQDAVGTRKTLLGA